MIGATGPLTLIAIVAVCALTLALGGFGLRWSRTTNDFDVAGRSTTPLWNASAVTGEFLSGASFLGVAGLASSVGVDMVWLPIGYLLGFVLQLIFVAGPLRRSGAYTVPDFVEVRLHSRLLRRLTGALVVVTGWLYLLPQLVGAGLATRVLLGCPEWVGGLAVALVVTVNALAGGMRSLTLMQAVHYWLKLAAISIPALVLLWWWASAGGPAPQRLWPAGSVADLPPLDGAPAATRLPGQGTYAALSTVLALALGTMGLPHVVVRTFANRDGRAARQTSVVVIGLLGLFYLFPPVYAALGRVYLPDLPPGREGDLLMVLLPTAMDHGPMGQSLTALLAAGAFTAFLSTASAVTVAVATVLEQGVVRPAMGLAVGTRGTLSLRIATVIAIGAPCLVLAHPPVASLPAMVGLAFAMSAATFAPVLILGIWWRHLTAPGLIAGVAVGSGATGLAALATLGDRPEPGWAGQLAALPALWAVPAAVLVTVVVSWSTRRLVPRDSLRTLVQLHTPESLDLS